ncbi:MAG: carbonic anhydrase [Christensenellaceae bacterium]|nr:carbonic anhydrase [Christensenellaceae bacterium]
MSINNTYSAEEALKKLKDGNERYLFAMKSEGDVSLAIRKKTCAEGQNPYAVIVACSDSRVIPESIFSAGIGEVFVIRVAGNVIDNHQLGSIEYAVEHLGCRLVVVMGHDHCGAVDSAINHQPENYIKFITDEIRKAIGEETDDYVACCLNVRHSVKVIEAGLKIRQHGEHDLRVCGALYHLEDGRVEFL